MRYLISRVLNRALCRLIIWPYTVMSMSQGRPICRSEEISVVLTVPMKAHASPQACPPPDNLHVRPHAVPQDFMSLLSRRRTISKPQGNMMPYKRYQ